MKKKYGIEGLFNRPTGVNVSDDPEPGTRVLVKEEASAFPKKAGRPKMAEGERVGDKSEYVTFQAEKETIAKVRSIADKEHLTIKNIIDTALNEIIRRYEEKHGPVKVCKQKNNDKTLLDVL